DEIKRLNDSGQPVLVGTTSIEKSEQLSDHLKRKGIKHVVLNAKYHEKEAEIVAQAGRKGMVTIATNMAGRGTDILLGGNPEFMAKQECVQKESGLISRRIQKAQEAVEAQHFEARKHVLEYDDVMNKQREAVYGLRRQLLEGVDQKDLILEDYVAGILSELLDQHCAVKT